jgi:glycosyltransferase involved in cell wall biosynthesis
MKKVLIIGCIWPYHLESGARVPGLAKYISEFGWEPIVLTMPLPGNPNLDYRVIEVPYRDMLKAVLKLLGLDTSKNIRKQVSNKLGVTSKKSFMYFVFRCLRAVFRCQREILAYPDSNRGWKSPAIKAGGELLQKEDIRAIISASPPLMGNLIARELKERYKIPWLGDFPHLWSQNNAYPYSSLRRMFDTRLELKTLSHVDVLTTTSEPLAKKLRAMHKGKPVYVITHGFDPDTVNTVPDKVTDKFTITYTGGWHPIFREPSKLFSALQKLILRGAMEPENTEVRFYGNEENWIDSEVEKYGLSGIVKQYGRVPMEVAQAKQRESQLLFNPKWDDPRDPGIHSMKIFEYLAARRSILATGKYKDVVDELLDETGAGICAQSVEDVMQVLEKAYQEYKLKGEVAWRGDESKINNYSHREMARKFAEVLDSLEAVQQLPNNQQIIFPAQI